MPELNTLVLKDELLVIMAEEAGEVTQECMKLVRCPKNGTQRLTDELGDMLCMIYLAVDNDLISWASLTERVKVKEHKLKIWSSLYEQVTGEEND